MSNVKSNPNSYLVDAVVGARYHLLKVTAFDLGYTVYRGRDMRTGRQVDVVIPNGEGGDDGVRRRRLAERAEAIRTLRHPSLCNLVDWNSSDTSPFMVFEVPTGEPLSDILAKQGRYSLKDFAPIGTQILLALSHVHEAGLVHRNIFPDNIYVQIRDGRATSVKVGAMHRCSRLGELAEASTLSTCDSLAMELPPFTPTRVDPRDDVFALGLLFKTVVDLRNIQSSQQTTAHREIVKVFNACLSPAVETRPANASEVLEQYIECLPELDPSLRPAEEVAAALGRDPELPTVPNGVMPRRAPVERRNRWRLATAITVPALGLLVGVLATSSGAIAGLFSTSSQASAMPFAAAAVPPAAVVAPEQPVAVAAPAAVPSEPAAAQPAVPPQAVAPGGAAIAASAIPTGALLALGGGDERCDAAKGAQPTLLAAAAVDEDSDATEDEADAPADAEVEMADEDADSAAADEADGDVSDEADAEVVSDDEEEVVEAKPKKRKKARRSRRKRSSKKETPDMETSNSTFMGVGQ